MKDDYLQPDFYHFNEDSIQLVRFIKENIDNSTEHSALEVGAGCGVISCELFKNVGLKSLLLVELQAEFLPYLKDNLDSVGIKNYSIHQSSFSGDDFLKVVRSKNSLVCFNPPYFFNHEGRSSNNSQLETCRRIERSDFLKWFKNSFESLEAGGLLFFCHRSDTWQAKDFGFTDILKEKGPGATFYFWKKEN